MVLASAQTSPKQGDINANLLEHYNLIDSASKKGAHVIVFPEMSITGYVREEAERLAFYENDSRLDNLKKYAVDNKIIIIAGAPIKIKTDLFIGAFVFFPNNSVSIYTKQFLHSGEEKFFKSSFDYNPIIELNNERLSLAICADIDHCSHPAFASKSKSTIYIASLFFTPNGIPNAHNLLGSYAKQYSMDILMSNYSGESWDLPAGGRSGFWTKEGELIGELNNSETGLLLVEKHNGKWRTK